MILAIINNKGGTGKTTTAVNLSAGLAILRKKKTLLIDMDGQGSASLSMGIDRTDLKPSIADVILDGSSMANAIRKTDIPKLDLVTGSPDLVNADLVLAEVSGRERRLSNAINTIRSDYDFIIIDCPPSLSMLVVNAMVAADAFIVPMTPEYLALEGLVSLMEAVNMIKEGIGDHCQLMGILLTKVDRRRRVTDEIIQVIRDHYKDKVLQSEIKVDVKLVESPSFGQNIFEYASRSSGSEAYRQLVNEVIRKKGKMS